MNLTVEEYLKKFPEAEIYREYLMRLSNKQRHPREESTMCQVYDDWHGNYPGNYACLSLISMEKDKYSRVCVWGTDDDGMELDVDHHTAKQMYDILKGCVLYKSILKDFGFIQA